MGDYRTLCIRQEPGVGAMMVPGMQRVRTLVLRVCLLGMSGWAQAQAQAQVQVQAQVQAQAQAQTPTTRPIGLREAVHRALARDPRLGISGAEVERARADVAQAAAGRYPKATLLTAVGIVPGARVGLVPDGLPLELAPLFSEDRATDIDDLNVFARVDLQLRQPLYTFGKLKYGNDAARFGLDARLADADVVRMDIILEVKRVYYGCQLAGQVLKVVEAVEEAFGEAVEKAEERLLRGDEQITQPDLLKLKFALAQARRRTLAMRTRQSVARAALNRLVGAVSGAAVVPEDDVLRPEQHVDVEALQRPGALVAALQARPEWRAVDRGLAARQAALQQEKRRLYPDVFAAGLFRYSVAPGRDNIKNPFLVDGFNDLEGGLFVGLRGELDPFGNAANVGRVSAEVRQLEAKRERAREGLELEINQALWTFQERSEAMDLARDERRHGRALMVLAMANFRIGIGDAADVLSALGIYTQAATTYLSAAHDFNMALAELSRAIGYELAIDLADGATKD